MGHSPRCQREALPQGRAFLLPASHPIPTPAIAAPQVPQAHHATPFLTALTAHKTKPTAQSLLCPHPKSHSRPKTTIWIQQILQQSLSLSHFSATKFPTLPTQSLPCHTPIIPCHQQPTQGLTSAQLTLNSNTNKTWCNLGLRANLWDFPTATQLKS